MPVTDERRRTRFKMLVRSVDDKGATHQVTLSPVTSTDTDHEERELDPDPDGHKTFDEYANQTPSGSCVFTTSEPNRWVVGEVFYLDVKPTR